MKKSLLTFGALSLFSFAFSGAVEAQDISDAELLGLSKKLFKIHNTQSTEEFLALIHPECPELPDWRIAASMEGQWIENPNNQVRYKTIDEVYEPGTWNFKVPAERIIEFQVMTKTAKDKTELITGYPVARYKGEVKILEYPCMEPKE